MKHKHWSPLEMVSVCMEVETTRDIARQLLRHRSFSFQEFSQRYADPTQDLILRYVKHVYKILRTGRTVLTDPDMDGICITGTWADMQQEGHRRRLRSIQLRSKQRYCQRAGKSSTTGRKHVKQAVR